MLDDADQRSGYLENQLSPRVNMLLGVFCYIFKC